ncbi:dihydrolipoyllysine-residue succinyltransferase component of 2-oxoglutarate dehydrogenase complex, mitochondrial isoform X1 [Neopelma chrysocephalum]|uniref:dihydrolipoyllysine-residue succinyltransferase component of 2-oxoglutarate dehydrogenase complex, mitochondrial isoform X1 n=1 Tax=Neopelma chrysocephalum TaxID=114329 RepID=UPI000FCD0663|nr:dihydrolipoyllysine-residue succinyltransferase component of 2-oxoglutarate dehydrogenase complex, mitochondrial isoform X1 [Neopelma chrysocephalum]
MTPGHIFRLNSKRAQPFVHTCTCTPTGGKIPLFFQGNCTLARCSLSGVAGSQGLAYTNSRKLLVNSSSVFTVRYFRTTAVRRDDVVTVNTPAFAESVTEGDVRWEKAVGDTVAEDEVVCEIETDKTSVQVPAPAAGVIEALLVPDGGKVEGGTPLFKLRKTGAAPAKAKPAAAPPPPPAPEPVAAAAPPPPPPAAPIPTTMPPVPPVSTQPIDSKPVSAVKPAAAPAAASLGEAVPTKGVRSEHRVKMNRMRQRIAQRLKEAQNTCAMLTTFNEIDMSNIREMRAVHKDTFLKKHNLKLGFMSAFVKAAAFALQDQPVVNAVIDDTTKEIVYRDYVDISVAVATPRGLVVPVVRNVENMNFADIERAIYELGEKARKNELAIEDMDGGTFTISNGGVFGSLFGTPIINPPQSAILGMHAIFDRPVAVGGKIEVRPMMYVALTYDHRLIDGREAVTFLRKIKAAVEDPRVLLLDL